jgi:hypothetical protein
MELTVRWKFTAKIPKKHTRNINTTPFCPDEAILPARQAQKQSRLAAKSIKNSEMKMML